MVRRKRFGAMGIYIPYEMGSELGSYQEFPDHILVMYLLSIIIFELLHVFYTNIDFDDLHSLTLLTISGFTPPTLTALTAQLRQARTHVHAECPTRTDTASRGDSQSAGIPYSIPPPGIPLEEFSSLYTRNWSIKACFKACQNKR